MTHKLKFETWENYTKSWSISDHAIRLKLFEKCLSPDCVYTDPLVQVTGYEQLSQYMSELHNNIPGVRFITNDFKSHHDQSLTHWNMMDDKGNKLSEGTSFGVYGSDDRLLRMSGFFALPENA